MYGELAQPLKVMAEGITIKSRFDGQYQHGSFTQHMWHRYRWWVMLRSLLCMGAIAFGAFLMIKDPGSKRGNIGGIVVMVGSFGFLRPMLWQMWQERGLRKHPAYGSEVTYHFSSEGMSMEGEMGEVCVPWEKLYELKMTKKGLLVYIDKTQYLWISKLALSEAQISGITTMYQAR